MATKLGMKLGQGIRKTFKVASPNAIRTILQESGLSLSNLKEAARNNAVKHEQTAAEKSAEANRLAVEARASMAKATDINQALAELDSADGKL